MIDDRFRVALIHLDGVVLVAVAGDIDIRTAPSVDLALRKALTARSRKMVVDLRKVTVLGPDAVRALSRASRSAEAAGVAVKMVGITPLMRRALDTTDASNVLGI